MLSDLSRAPHQRGLARRRAPAHLRDERERVVQFPRAGRKYVIWRHGFAILQASEVRGGLEKGVGDVFQRFGERLVVFRSFSTLHASLHFHLQRHGLSFQALQRVCTYRG